MSISERVKYRNKSPMRPLKFVHNLDILVSPAKLFVEIHFFKKNNQ